MNTIKRTLQDKISERIEPNKAILLFGARRVGKTVLMRELIKTFSGKSMLLNGEDYDTIALLNERSVANYRHLLEGIDLLAIDEAQNIPDIGSKLKLIVDEIEGVRVIASGSSSFDLLNKAGEPLVGRSTQFRLNPFSQNEISQMNQDEVYVPMINELSTNYPNGVQYFYYTDNLSLYEGFNNFNNLNNFDDKN